MSDTPPVNSQSPDQQEILRKKRSEADDKKFFGYMKVFLVPTLVLKVGILYFGIHYSSEPDVGYGWGLVITIALSLFNFAFFIYKNWSDMDEEDDRR